MPSSFYWHPSPPHLPAFLLLEFWESVPFSISPTIPELPGDRHWTRHPNMLLLELRGLALGLKEGLAISIWLPENQVSFLSRGLSLLFCRMRMSFTKGLPARLCDFRSGCP